MGYYRDLVDDLTCHIADLKIQIRESGYEKAKKTRKLNKIKKLVDYLESHNKNYTKVQYETILEIKETLED